MTHKGRVSPFGDPRIEARLPAPLGLSQVPTSFIAFRRQDIHRAPFSLITPARCRPRSDTPGPQRTGREERGATTPGVSSPRATQIRDSASHPTGLGSRRDATLDRSAVVKVPNRSLANSANRPRSLRPGSFRHFLKRRGDARQHPMWVKPTNSNRRAFLHESAPAGPATCPATHRHPSECQPGSASAARSGSSINLSRSGHPHQGRPPAGLSRRQRRHHHAHPPRG